MKHLYQDRQHLFWNEAATAQIKSCHFEPQHWQEQGAVVGRSHGRGETLFVSHPEGDWVLRHYRRGGLIARLTEDLYIYTGLAATRVWREFELLNQMHEQGLPVPRAVAGRVTQHGLCYRADILIDRIEGAQDLVAMLKQAPLPPANWQQIGKVIRLFHQRGIWHADLNAHNILLDHEGKVFLIDFDRGSRRQPDADWHQHNLDRLYRSLQKEQGLDPQLHWSTDDWQALLEGYRH